MKVTSNRISSLSQGISHVFSCIKLPKLFLLQLFSIWSLLLQPWNFLILEAWRIKSWNWEGKLCAVVLHLDWLLLKKDCRKIVAMYHVLQDCWFGGSIHNGNNFWGGKATLYDTITMLKATIKTSTKVALMTTLRP